VPNTSNYAFEYESPSSLPGTTLTGGPGGGSPILAVQVDSTIAAIETRVDNNTDSIALNTAAISANGTSITDLQNWTRRGTVLISFTTLNASTAVVNFGFTFPTVPTIVTNIDSGAGATARWESRAITATTTGFTMFVYQSQANTGTWVDIPVSYIATYRA
jgi:hypothetical protein